MADDSMITPETVSLERIRALFDAAYMESSIDKDGDLEVSDGGIWAFVFLSEQKDRIRLHAGFSWKPDIYIEQKYAFCNQANRGYTFIKVHFNPEPDNKVAIFEYDVWLRGGVTERNFVYTVKRFLSIPRAAIKDYGDDLFV